MSFSSVESALLLPPIMSPMRATVHDVAQLAGCSAMTVSRVVNTPSKVSIATAAKVRAAIAATGYVPNLLAGGLRSSKSRLIAAFVPTLVGPIYSEMILGLTSALTEQGYYLTLGQTGYSATGEGHVLAALLGRRPDGVVLTGVHHSEEMRQKISGLGIPIVETWDLTPTPIDMLVGFSHADIGAAVCRRFYEKGRRRLAVVSAGDERARRRSSAFCQTALDLGMDDPFIHEVQAPTTLGQGRAATKEILLRAPGTDAIFCSSDSLALGVLVECHASGINVPGRFLLIGFGDIELAKDLHPALTTVRVDGLRIGREAANCIVARAEGREVSQTIQDIGFSLVGRDTG